MRKPLVLITLFTLGVIYTSVAQQLKKSSATSSQVATSLAPEKIQEIQKQIAQIDGHFQAIESKKSYVLADSVETVKALESGWFEANGMIFSGDTNICSQTGCKALSRTK